MNYNGKTNSSTQFSNIFATTVQIIIHMKQLVEGQYKNFEKNSNSKIIPAILDVYEQMNSKQEYLNIDPFVNVMMKRFDIQRPNFVDVFSFILREIDFTYETKSKLNESKICYTELKDKKSNQRIESFYFNIPLDNEKISNIIKEKYEFSQNDDRPYFIFFHPVNKKNQPVSICIDEQVYLNPENYILSIIVAKKNQKSAFDHYILFIFIEKWYQIEDENILPIESKEDIFSKIADQNEYQIELFGYCQNPNTNIVPFIYSNPLEFEYSDLDNFKRETSSKIPVVQYLSSSQSKSQSSTTKLQSSKPSSRSSSSSSSSSSPLPTPPSTPHPSAQSSSKSSPLPSPRSKQREISTSTTDDEYDELPIQSAKSTKKFVESNNKEQKYINKPLNNLNNSPSNQDNSKSKVNKILSSQTKSCKKDNYTVVFVDFDYDTFKNNKPIEVKNFETSEEKEQYIEQKKEQAKSNTLFYSAKMSFGKDYISDPNDKYITIYSVSKEPQKWKKIVQIIFCEYSKNLQENDDKLHRAFFPSDAPIKALFEYSSKNLPGNPKKLILKIDDGPSSIDKFKDGKKKITPYGRTEKPKIIYYIPN